MSSPFSKLFNAPELLVPGVKPRGLVQADRSNPICVGAKVILPLNEGAGKPINADGRQLVDSSTATWKTGPKGLLLNFDDSLTQSVILGRTAKYGMRTPGEFSCIIEVAHTSGNGGINESYVNNRGGDSGSNTGFDFYSGNYAGSVPNQTGKMAFVLSGVAAYTVSTTFQINDTNFIGISFRNNDTIRFYLNGVFAQQFSVGNMKDPGVGDLRFGIRNSDQYLNADVGHLLVVDRYLTDQQHKSYYDNWTQVLEPIAPMWMPEAPTTPSVGAIMNQLQRSNLGADLYNGTIQ